MHDTLYTLGIWIVKPGREDDFVAAWGEMAMWTKTAFEGAEWATLLRDARDGRRFISLGPWRSKPDVEKWRESEGFRTRVAGIRELLESFEAGNFHLAYDAR